MASQISYIDYLTFAVFFLISALIGVFHMRNKQKIEELLTKKGVISAMPAGLSIFGTLLVGLNITGVPAESYLYGCFELLMCLSFFLAYWLIAPFPPFFRKHKYYSSFQYFRFRYGRSVEIVSILLFMVDSIVWLSLNIYIPSLIVYEVAGLNIGLVSFLTLCVCCFYTAMGGIKAVIWTDSFQVLVILISLLTIAIKSTWMIGFNNVVEVSYKSKRFTTETVLNFSFDPTQRYTVWAVVVGPAVITGTIYATSQANIQRFILVDSNKDVVKSIIYSMLGFVVIMHLLSYIGILILARLLDCDPLSTKAVAQRDQLLPYFIMQMGFPSGFIGIFLSAIWGASLSTASTKLESAAVVFTEEIKRYNFYISLSEGQRNWVPRCFIVALSVFTLFFSFLLPYVPSLAPFFLQVCGSLGSILYALFVLGRWVKFSNEGGVLIGFGTTFMMVVCMTLGAMMASNRGENISSLPLPLNVSGCPANITSTYVDRLEEQPLAPYLFRISHLYSGLIILIVMMATSMAASALIHGVSRLFLSKREVKDPAGTSLNEQQNMESTDF